MTYRSGYATLFGRPNVGKSTLLNRLLGQKLAITSHKPQTTRHRILGIRSQEDGQTVFIDTPGLHARGDKGMSHYLNRTAKAALQDVDVVVFVTQALVWTDEDQRAREALQDVAGPVVCAINKVDEIADKTRLLPFIDRIAGMLDGAEIVPVSATEGDNVEVLAEAVRRRLPVGEPIFAPDQLTDRPERFFAAELLREQVIRRYHRELPYAVTVEIERFEADAGRYNIGAVIWVEREGQRAILLGKGGLAMKDTATAARLAMKDFFQTPVHLDVWVKVKKSWSSDESSLASLGYTD